MLYHYTSLDTFLKIVESGKIRLSDLSQSNDALEGKFIQDHLCNSIWSSKIPTGLHSELEETVEILIQSERAFGFCLSKMSDELSQWRGYGDDGYGMCLGFDQFALQTAIRGSHHETRQASIFEVIYGDKDAVKRGKKMVREIEALKISENETQDVAFQMESFLLIGDPNEEEAKKKAGLAYMAAFNAVSDCFRYKADAFREEKEWRVLHPGRWQDSENVSYHARRGRIAAYLEVDFGDALREVVIGPKSSVSTQDLSRVLSRFGLNEKKAGRIKVGKSASSYR